MSCRYIFNLNIHLFLLSTLFIHSSGFSDNCNLLSKTGNVFIDRQLLKATKVFTNLNKEPKCPKTSCDDYCKIQLRNVSVSNMLPCCVQLMNGKSVCQCVIAFPDSNNNLTQCPPPNLKLVSNQIFNMSGISRFFSIKVPVCGTIHFSYNIYKGIGPKINTTAEPFLEPNLQLKSGFKVNTGYTKDGWFIYFYVEFVTTCRFLLDFISDDLPFCEKCNEELPHVNIVLDIDTADINNSSNAVFKNLKSQPKCLASSPLPKNQCPAINGSGCDAKQEPCCYSKRCMFPYISKEDTCPCPPNGSELFFANNFPLTCTTDNKIYLFNKNNPPVTQEFIWDLDPNLLALGFDQLLVGRGTIKSPVANANVSIYWFGEFRLSICAFSDCLDDVLRYLKLDILLKILKSITKFCPKI